MLNYKPFIIGVTGSINSGKSTFCRFLADELNCLYIDADKIVDDLYKSKKISIKDFFPKEGILDKRKLAEVVFSSSKNLNKVEKIIHPLVYKEILKLIKKEEIVIIEAVKLKGDLRKLVDFLILINCPFKEVLKRNSKKYPKELLKKIYDSFEMPTDFDLIL